MGLSAKDFEDFESRVFFFQRGHPPTNKISNVKQISIALRYLAECLSSSASRRTEQQTISSSPLTRRCGGSPAPVGCRLAFQHPRPIVFISLGQRDGTRCAVVSAQCQMGSN